MYEVPKNKTTIYRGYLSQGDTPNVKNQNGPNKRASQYYPESHCKNNIIKLDSGFRRNDSQKTYLPEVTPAKAGVQ
jgi:hypothetical protein